MKGSQSWRNFLVDPAVLLFFMGHFMKKAAIVDLIYQKTCLSVYDLETCVNIRTTRYESEFAHVQSLSSIWILVSQVMLAGPAIIIALYAGTWSDKVDRKIPILIPAVGEIFSTLVVLIMAAVPTSSLFLIILGQGISGLTGNYVTTLYASSSYVTSDCQPDKRTIRLAIIEGASGIGGALGPFLSGVFMKLVKQQYVYVIILAINVIQCIYVMVVIKSKKPVLSELTDGKSVCGSLFGVEPLVELWRTTFRARRGYKRMYIIFAVIILFIALTISLGTFDILYLYTKAPPLNWSYSLFSTYVSLLFVGRVVGAFLILPIFRRFTNASDPVVIAIGIVVKIVGLIMLGFMDGLGLAIAVIVAETSFAFIMAGAKGLVSKTVNVDEQGKIFSLLAVVDDLSILLATVVFNVIFAATRNGFLFELSAGLFVPPLILAIIMIYYNHKPQPCEEKHLLNYNSEDSDYNPTTENYKYSTVEYNNNT